MPDATGQTPETFMQKLQDDEERAKKLLVTVGEYLKADFLELEHIAPLVEGILPVFVKSAAARSAMQKGEDIFAAVENAIKGL